MPYRQATDPRQLAEERAHVAAEREAETRITEAGAAQGVTRATESLDRARKRVGDAVRRLRQLGAEAATAGTQADPTQVAALTEERSEGEAEVLEASRSLDLARLALAAARRRVVLARREHSAALSELARLSSG